MPNDKAFVPNGTVLAFDFGIKRIGVAVADTQVSIAHPLYTIATEITETRFTRIAQLIQEWQPQFLLVGLPFYMDGKEHEISRLSRRFARRLVGRFALPVYMWDERLSSAAASESLTEIGINTKAQKEMIDQVAAKHILQHYLDSTEKSRFLILP